MIVVVGDWIMDKTLEIRCGEIAVADANAQFVLKNDRAAILIVISIFSLLSPIDCLNGYIVSSSHAGAC